MATDKTGAITWKAVSEAFGASRAVESDVQVNLRFPGQYWDQESGRHYNYHRDYESNTGRYLQGAPIGLKGGVNRYIYAEGSPLVYMDSMGLQTTLNWCLKNPQNATTCNEVGIFPKPIRIPPTIVFPNDCDELCKKAIVDASNAWWKLTAKRLPQYESGGTRGRDGGHSNAVLELQKALREAIQRVKLHYKTLPAALPEGEHAANEPLPE